MIWIFNDILIDSGMNKVLDRIPARSAKGKHSIEQRPRFSERASVQFAPVVVQPYASTSRKLPHLFRVEPTKLVDGSLKPSHEKRQNNTWMKLFSNNMKNQWLRNMTKTCPEIPPALTHNSTTFGTTLCDVCTPSHNQQESVLVVNNHTTKNIM